MSIMDVDALMSFIVHKLNTILFLKPSLIN
jgi:hypothetical protein